MSDVTIYYLEMTSPHDFKPAVRGGDLTIVELKIPDFRLNQYFYRAVGEPWGWTDKQHWSDEEWMAYVNNPALKTWVAYQQDTTAGYFELSTSHHDDVEIAYFGLTPPFIGKGHGGYLLSQAIKHAWEITQTKRVWVHTCTLDHPAALNNYVSRGFKIYHQEQRAKKLPSDSHS